MKIEIVSRYNIQDLKENLNKIFIFGDNFIGRGKGGQAIIRDESNAFGIPTKRYPSNESNSFLYDNDFDSFKEIIDKKIEELLNKSEILVFPEDGLGTGLAKLYETSPKCFSYLCDELLKNFKFENKIFKWDSIFPVKQLNFQQFTKTNLKYIGFCSYKENQYDLYAYEDEEKILYYAKYGNSLSDFNFVYEYKSVDYPLNVAKRKVIIK